MEDQLEDANPRTAEENAAYWQAPLGGYTILPDGTPILPTSNSSVVLHRNTGQPGTIVNGSFVPSL